MNERTTVIAARRSRSNRAKNLVIRAAFWWINRRIIDPFHRLFYDSGWFTWSDTKWLGVPTQKCPLDLWVYQEILEELRPAVIVESGTAFGGSALFLASMCDLLGGGEVITIDVDPCPDRPVHDRITYVTGSSTAPDTVEQVAALIGAREPVLVILDSDHTKNHVLGELRLYRRFVSPGSYLVVEDTNVNGHPVVDDFGPGPTEAVDAFLAEDSAFFVDKTREKYFLTFNPNGYLCRRSRSLDPNPTL
jgi:cephalosporin hydroxylase